MKPALVLLHGWAINSNVWNPILDELESEFELSIVDLPGYGDDAGYQEDYSLDTVVEAVLARAPKVANWVGWSLGGTIAIAAALKHPERFEKLQLVSTTPRFVNCENWTAGSKSTSFDNLVDDCKTDQQSAIRKFLMLAALNSSKPKQSVRLVRKLENELSKSASPTLQTLLAGLEILRSTDLRPQLGELRVETQVVAGFQDQITPPQASRHLFEQLPNGHSFHCLEASHLPFLQATSGYIEKLASFIKNTAY